MSAVIEREHQAVATSDAAALIHTITQAAKDPTVDINKLERLMAMHEKIVARDSERAFNVAMVACQSDLRQVAPDADNPQTRSKYATYAKLDSVLRPIYTKHGFSLSFDEGEAPGKVETVRVVCYVAHTGGHTRTYHRDMPADGKGAKGGDVMTKTHAAGAAGSYGARYLLKGIFNVAIGEYDEDGNSPSGKRLDEGTTVDHLNAIDTATDDTGLLRAYGVAHKAAIDAEDMKALRLFTKHKDQRKKALGAK
jgi:ERF superfamily protein